MGMTDWLRGKRGIRVTDDKTKMPEPDLKEKPVLEKGDLPAILIAAFFNFILPIMLLCSLICFLTYLFFTRVR